MAFPAFLDACALYPFYMCNTLLLLAEEGCYRPLWSAIVLDEVTRALVRDGVAPESAARREEAMRMSFPDAEVAGFESLIPAMTNDEGDRHVLAAAVRADAAVIVTFNRRHFPPPALEPFELETRHPDDFLLDQLDLYPAHTLRCLRDQVERSKAEWLRSIPDLLGALAVAGAPNFAAEVRRHL